MTLRYMKITAITITSLILIGTISQSFALAPFVDPTKDPQSYIDRYNSQKIHFLHELLSQVMLMDYQIESL